MTTEDKKQTHAGDAHNWQEFQQELREKYTEREWKRLYYGDWRSDEQVEEPFAPHHITDMLERECPELLK